MNEVFLESTVNADRNFATTKRQIEIRRQLSGKAVVSSRYVIGELKNNFLRNSITFHHLLLDEETVEDALRQLSRVLRSQRQFDRVIKVFSYLVEKAGYDRDEILDRLDMLIEDSMEVLFAEGIDEFVDSCACVRADAVPRREGRRWMIDIGCRQNPRPNCSIVAFMANHRNSLQQISEIESVKQTTMGERLDKMNKNQIKKYGTNCWKVGDAVIALEAPQESPIYTTNKKDYEPICAVLDKRVYEEF